MQTLIVNDYSSVVWRGSAFTFWPLLRPVCVLVRTPFQQLNAFGKEQWRRQTCLPSSTHCHQVCIPFSAAADVCKNAFYGHYEVSTSNYKWRQNVNTLTQLITRKRVKVTQQNAQKLRGCYAVAQKTMHWTQNETATQMQTNMQRRLLACNNGRHNTVTTSTQNFEIICNAASMNPTQPTDATYTETRKKTSAPGQQQQVVRKHLKCDNLQEKRDSSENTAKLWGCYTMTQNTVTHGMLQLVKNAKQSISDSKKPTNAQKLHHNIARMDSSTAR